MQSRKVGLAAAVLAAVAAVVLFGVLREDEPDGRRGQSVAIAQADATVTPKGSLTEK
jgi:hypothetical protein